jgi:hypothetical protein
VNVSVRTEFRARRKIGPLAARSNSRIPSLSRGEAPRDPVLTADDRSHLVTYLHLLDVVTAGDDCGRGGHRVNPSGRAGSGKSIWHGPNR